MKCYAKSSEMNQPSKNARLDASLPFAEATKNVLMTTYIVGLKLMNWKSGIEASVSML